MVDIKSCGAQQAAEGDTVERFYEIVESPEGKSRVLKFRPRTGGLWYVACLRSKWTNPEGEEADLYSFAAITDECEAEMAAAGNDRKIVNLKPEYVDVQLNPQPIIEQVLRDFR